jgi:hypothetical protein
VNRRREMNKKGKVEDTVIQGTKKGISLLEGCQASPSRPCGYSRIKMRICEEKVEVVRVVA